MMIKKIFKKYGANMKKSVIIFLIVFIIIIVVVTLLYNFRIIPYKQYSNSDFNIETYISNVDKDNDGIDDQTDILNNVREYIKTKPKYKRKYYGTGYPDDEYEVCTDVVANGLKGAGYDLSKIEEWQGGDIIVFKGHIGIISDKRKRKGIPFLIHHANPMQINCEEDVLELYGQEYIIRHYRIS